MGLPVAAVPIVFGLLLIGDCGGIGTRIQHASVAQVAGRVPPRRDALVDTARGRLTTPIMEDDSARTRVR